MKTFGADKAWKELGEADPYYGVLTDERFSREKLNEAALADFFASGQRLVDKVFRNIESFYGPGFQPQDTLDFGCGTGRLSIPLARRSGRVVGVDISEGMLREARANCRRQGIGNASFLLTDAFFKEDKAPAFNLAISFLVFQHMNVEKGEAALEKILQLLRPGGIGALHFTFYREQSGELAFIRFMQYRIPLFYRLVNLASGRGFHRPLMQMNHYDLNRLFFILNRRGVTNFHSEFTQHGEHLGMALYFKMPKK